MARIDCLANNDNLLCVLHAATTAAAAAVQCKAWNPSCSYLWHGHIKWCSSCPPNMQQWKCQVSAQKIDKQAELHY